jgi:glycerate kinase
MKILIAPDKFKGVLTARQAAESIAAGITDILPGAEIEIVPIADGGEGTAAVIHHALGGTWRECEARNAHGSRGKARYLWLPQRETAVMEMSEVAGWKNLGPSCDIDHATTFGVGKMMVDAAALGAREIMMGLGGSVTNDGGFGMARALGFRFFDRAGLALEGAVMELKDLMRIAKPETPLRLARVVVAADVRNPLLGANGATRIFGPQKGATPEQVDSLEEALETLADVVTQDFGVDYRSTPGAGAAGGLAFALLSFCGATIRPGFEVVAEALQLKDKIGDVDIVVTGEGRLDGQTLEGKAPAEVALMARSLGKRVFAIVGHSDGDARLGGLFDGIIAVADPARSETENIRCAPDLLRMGGQQLAASLL